MHTNPSNPFLLFPLFRALKTSRKHCKRWWNSSTFILEPDCKTQRAEGHTAHVYTMNPDVMLERQSVPEEDAANPRMLLLMSSCWVLWRFVNQARLEVSWVQLAGPSVSASCRSRSKGARSRTNLVRPVDPRKVMWTNKHISPRMRRGNMKLPMNQSLVSIKVHLLVPALRMVLCSSACPPRSKTLRYTLCVAECWISTPISLTQPNHRRLVWSDHSCTFCMLILTKWSNKDLGLAHAGSRSGMLGNSMNIMIYPTMLQVWQRTFCFAFQNTSKFAMSRAVERIWNMCKNKLEHLETNETNSSTPVQCVCFFPVYPRLGGPHGMSFTVV